MHQHHSLSRNLNPAGTDNVSPPRSSLAAARTSTRVSARWSTTLIARSQSEHAHTRNTQHERVRCCSCQPTSCAAIDALIQHTPHKHSRPPLPRPSCEHLAHHDTFDVRTWCTQTIGGAATSMQGSPTQRLRRFQGSCGQAYAQGRRHEAARWRLACCNLTPPPAPAATLKRCC
jgi:hypothetical protein